MECELVFWQNFPKKIQVFFCFLLSFSVQIYWTRFDYDISFNGIDFQWTLIPQTYYTHHKNTDQISKSKRLLAKGKVWHTFFHRFIPNIKQTDVFNINLLPVIFCLLILFGIWFLCFTIFFKLHVRSGHQSLSLHPIHCPTDFRSLQAMCALNWIVYFCSILILIFLNFHFHVKKYSLGLDSFYAKIICSNECKKSLKITRM